MEKFKKAIESFDLANSQDPNKEIWEGRGYPKELLYAQRMTQWLERLAPNASEALRLAVRAQHLCRWMIPRNQYHMNRAGYLKWRTTLYEFHAQKTGKILAEVGYTQPMIQRVQELLRQKEIKSDPEMQLLEDVICLVFLESYFDNFLKKHEKEKVISIVNKTWKKMSPQAQTAALCLNLPSQARALIEKAITI